MDRVRLGIIGLGNMGQIHAMDHECRVGPGR